MIQKLHNNNFYEYGCRYPQQITRKQNLVIYESDCILEPKGIFSWNPKLVLAYKIQCDIPYQYYK
jgi:hypothetical protein